MLVLIECPSCRERTRISSQFLGIAVECKNCGHKFMAQRIAPVPPPIQEGQGDQQQRWRGEGGTDAGDAFKFSVQPVGEREQSSIPPRHHSCTRCNVVTVPVIRFPFGSFAESCGMVYIILSMIAIGLCLVAAADGEPISAQAATLFAVLIVSVQIAAHTKKKTHMVCPQCHWMSDPIDLAPRINR